MSTRWPLRGGCLLLVFLVASCASAPPPEPGDSLETDRCSTLRRECLAGYDYSDDDGCPDPPTPEATFTEGATLDERSVRMLNDVGYEGAHLWPGAMIRLVAIGTSGADRITVVRRTLVGAGTPNDRITEGGIAPEGEITDGVRIAVDGCAL